MTFSGVTQQTSSTSSSSGTAAGTLVDSSCDAWRLTGADWLLLLVPQLLLSEDDSMILSEADEMDFWSGCSGLVVLEDADDDVVTEDRPCCLAGVGLWNKTRNLGALTFVRLGVCAWEYRKHAGLDHKTFNKLEIYHTKKRVQFAPTSFPPMACRAAGARLGVRGIRLLWNICFFMESPSDLALRVASLFLSRFMTTNCSGVPRWKATRMSPFYC